MDWIVFFRVIAWFWAVTSIAHLGYTVIFHWDDAEEVPIGWDILFASVSVALLIATK